MEQEVSTRRSFLGESSSETASDEGMEESYTVESGFYMSTFAATIFVAAFVTLAIMLLTTLIWLAVTLKSCKAKSSPTIQQPYKSESFGYCSVFLFQMELNNFEVDEIPATCKAYVMEYMNHGKYLQDLNLTLMIAETYFSNFMSNRDDLDVILMDLDDILDTYQLPQYRDGHNQVMKIRCKLQLHGLYMKLLKCGWRLVLFTRSAETQIGQITDALLFCRFRGWSRLIMRSDDELEMDSWEYISRKRVELHNQGFHIASIISSKFDAMVGPFTGKHNFKLPTSVHYKSKVVS